MSPPEGKIRTANIDKLREILASVPAGRIHCQEQLKRIEKALMGCWNVLANSSDTSMNADKLAGRMEKVSWEPPLLSFIIERHGRTVNSSTRADLHKWTIDTSKQIASWQGAGYRPILPMAKAFKAGPIAKEIVELILSGADDQRLKWSEEGKEVVVDIAAIVPDGNSKQTMTDRRKRFRKACEDLLGQAGWEKVKYNKYRRKGE